jgi:hypothetical protein
MRIIYFTLGRALLDEHIRHQLVRIPEVLSEIKKVKFETQKTVQDPVLAFLSLTEKPSALSPIHFEDWVQVIQKGLFLRLRKAGFKYGGSFRRNRMTQQRSLESTLVPLLEARDQLEIWVIGPGFDDLEAQIQKIKERYRLYCEVTFVDVIDQDRKLKWFWAEIRQATLSEKSSRANDLMRH